MIAIERSGTIQTFTRLPNEWNDNKGYHINFRKITNKEDYGFYDVVTPEYDQVTQQSVSYTHLTLPTMFEV